VTIDTFVDITTELAAIYDCKRLLKRLCLRQKSKTSELKRLRETYTKKSWDRTHANLDAFVLQRFSDALDGKHPDSDWPISEPFKEGMGRIFDTHLPRLAKWIKRQRRGIADP